MTMPQLGETVTEGTITKWFKSIGDEVDRDEPLFEVSTDKVDSEVPSPAQGVVTAILVEEGDTVDVGVKLAVISDAASSNGDAPASAGAPPVAQGAPEAATGAATGAAAGDDPGADRATVGPAAGATVGADPPPAPVPGPAPGAAPPPPTHHPSAPQPLNGSGDRLVLSPVVRKLMNEHGIDPAAVVGTGLDGRITRGDVEEVIASRGDGGGSGPAAVPSIADSPAPGRPALAPSGPAPVSGVAPVLRSPGPAPGGPTRAVARDEVIPFTNIRRRTAEHMVRSKATSAHTLMVKEVDYERVERLRRAHGDQFRAEEGFGLTYLPFAASAAVEALAEFPHLNASVGDDSLIVHHDVNLGIAVDLDNEGLIVPVVHNAEELNLRGMARRIRDLADRARNKRLSLDDISGGTFSITNAGPFGTLITGAIINQPQVAILSTDGVARKPVVVELPDGTESIAIHSVGLAAMTFDHRAVDGAYVARYLARLAQILNERDWAGEL
ncbi:MAG TPA: 2-oxo acid dehydrogenase subunit E2 [Acidimicrobiales bacterium]